MALFRTALIRMFKFFAASSALVAAANAHGNHQETLKEGPHKSLWYNTLPGDGGTQADSVFSGISTFGRIEYSPCLANDDVKYDIAFLGAPFDTGTSYRPGARFGPSGIRQGSRRLNLYVRALYLSLNGMLTVTIDTAATMCLSMQTLSTIGRRSSTVAMCPSLLSTTNGRSSRLKKGTTAS